ncbi:substrate-specific activator of APC-dependent proteolysis [Elasticomyces elasticus]|uniref:Substrate-specific activator of APC-dependent proteolysis n=1 Tax=Exophiala sideris TaxID=1016849 RepID=A0ABR0JMF5_9EURO|nr:substrate-specific activator of APC-dependent proteolysis [Elasticomyces elasticus]KAK5036678.1 substrate-specific activator of APC-dependent proteolysis [Exophiala sideris]KAK5041495.1 substrate-specific activator of APC-dependent proteolysis [Exophiala sideris]KAK5067062.1 substrate-specific activator of APC-dependent proteolysis [Exophiala sideris]KAK5185120.1 substrate-specific activator of APC-dependent proteolysis [Eurotiomycetes sp. CCFEE 6388]
MAEDAQPSLTTDSTDRPRTPSLPTPVGSKTPPTIASRRFLGNDEGMSAVPRATEAMEEDALMRRLKGIENAGRSRERTPGRSPSRKRQRVYGDRFIPNRDGQDLQASYSLLHDDGSPATPSRSKKKTPHGELHFQRTEEANKTYSKVLRNELMGDSVPQDFRSITPDDLFGRRQTPPGQPSLSSMPPASITPNTPHKNMFSYKSPQKVIGSGHHPTPSSRTAKHPGITNLNARSDLYSISPINYSSQSILQTPRKQPRPIAKVPYKVLDAPELADDFYLNLVDWGSANILGVGLGSSVYMWNSTTGKVTQLCKLPDNDLVTSVAWIQRGSHLAIGTHKGFVQIYDAEKSRRLRTMTGHSARVGALAWNDHILSSGSRDRLIYHRDVRSPDQYLRRLAGHKQEVCGLRWNTEDGQLASGGNDNKLCVWDKLSETPLYRFSNHVAAVKAIAWSPHQHHLLASGGGTADRSIKFWNTATGSLIKEVDTGSQVCNLAWSKNSDEIVSTHGYSQNQIVVWKYPKMEQVVSLTGHTFRVLYLSTSPDGTTVVTGAGDETLRFWRVFGKKGNDGRDSDGMSSRLGDWGSIR